MPTLPAVTIYDGVRAAAPPLLQRLPADLPEARFPLRTGLFFFFFLPYTARVRISFLIYIPTPPPRRRRSRRLVVCFFRLVWTRNRQPDER